MNKKLVIGLSVGVSVTSLLSGIILFSIEVNNYKGYQVVHNNVSYSRSERASLDINDYTYTYSSKDLVSSDIKNGSLDIGTYVSENTNFNDLMFTLSFNLENVGKTKGYLSFYDTNDENKLYTFYEGENRIANVKYDKDVNRILQMRAHSFDIESVGETSLKISDIRLIVWGRK